MSLFGSLFTGVSGLSSQSQATAMISNNIANVNTVGFKRSEAAFYSLVTTEGRSSRYSPGSVSVNRIQRVDQQGPIQSSISSTDASISGNGFFPVKRDSMNSSLSEYLYTRNGQFSEDNQGYLRNSAGFYLYGWPLDQNGNLPSNQGDLTSLVPVDVAFLGGLTRPTTSAEISINLDMREADKTLADALVQGPDFQRSQTVYDSLGNPQPITYQFTKVYGPEATIAGTINNLTATSNLITDLGLTDGNQFSISVNGSPPRVYEVNTDGGATSGTEDVAVVNVGDIIDDINANVAGAHAYLGNNGEILIQSTDFTTPQSITIDNVIGTPAGSLGLGTVFPNTVNSTDLTGGPYENGTPADTPPYSTGTFPAMQHLPGSPQYNARGWYQVTVLDPNTNVLTRGMMNFNGDGTLNALADNDGNRDIELSQIDWGNGSEPQNVNIDISRMGMFSSDYTVLFTDQNGAELGLRTGVEVDRDGQVIARFSNGATAALYKIPLVTFANVNGLQEVSGTAYTESEESGEENLREAGTGGAGYLDPATLEISNVDLADEFAKLIVTQRAYSANTKIINTVDQMTEELLRLR